ncbi:Cytochrome b5-like Heme/Steroid binding domain containing protein [Trichomonas vaginalis G3]|uniref:Cytochrome b5 domain-containing protein 1 n=1 Tax=Trichomonas vaginalis (strain ATCC PRA-98 / G3) TaxID=412133 RepID=A2DKS7_TRIV3|nr:heme binding [Trichomonas vaginalis G3]EAY19060.1 Cytochrome b5-like Heme/Steroid binding domain containing protein [Trichomonas vaginalis G3]KAI5521135.1 heme binding [Trichomonas vaginalis G3]|eukprot:XP_001580046.1 Cytochrome b5-like Heme/Steroid binding domain containing protein [Trichomonas vaginalis G3]
MTKWILPSEVALHNTSTDCWVSFLGKVWDLTKLIADNKNDLGIQPIIKSAGTDISHWFNPDTKDIKTRIDPVTELEVPHVPFDCLLHLPNPTPNTTEIPVAKPWWKDESQIIGQLSKNPRYIRIVNTLTSKEDLIEVAGEETLNDILERFKAINSHADSYTWKFQGNVLKMEKTLEQNGIHDESAKFARLGLDFDMYIPAILIYFNDDLTAA